MNRNALVLLGVLVSALTAQAANIALVSFHSDAGGLPSAAAAGAGMTTAADIGYSSLLTANGHTVTRFASKDLPTAADATTYNGYDLIILSRSVASGHYQQAAETIFWNSTITKPVISLGGYINRQNRLGLMDGNTIPDTTGNVALSVLNPSHPIFAGIALDGGNLMVNSYAGIATFNSTVQRGISVVTGSLTNGVTLATVGTASDPAFGGMVIGEWQAGAKTSDAGAEILGGHRLVFLTGSREHNGAPTSEIAGIYDLTADGQAMFLNAVTYMAVIPEPSTYALLGIGALALIFRWRKA